MTCRAFRYAWGIQDAASMRFAAHEHAFLTVRHTLRFLPPLGDELAELSNRTPSMGLQQKTGLIRCCLIARSIYIRAGLVKSRGRLQTGPVTHCRTFQDAARVPCGLNKPGGGLGDATRNDVSQHPFIPSSLTTFLIFSLAALILTYPLIFHLTSHIPRGSEAVGTVPFFNLWTLQWNIDQLMRGYPAYWDAPIFAPHRGTFAFSESQPVSGLLAAPVWLSSGTPALGYNFVVILFLILNGWFAYWFLRAQGVSHLAALLSGLFVQALPFVAQEMGVLQLIALFGFLWSLFFLHRFLRLRQAGQSSWPVNLGLALGTPLTFFTCSYYGLFSLFFLPLAFCCHLRSNHLTRQTLGQLAAIGLLALALSGPFLWSQQQQLVGYGFTRSERIIENNSAKIGYYANFLDYNVLYGQVLDLESGGGQRLFPGIGLMLLAGIGLAGGGHLRTKIYLLAAVVLALLLSLGLRLDLDGWQPYQLVRDYVPGYAQLRSPFRFAAFVQLHLALLAGFGLHNLLRWLPHARGTLLPLWVTFILVESLALPLPLQAVPPLQPAADWQVWLNRQDPTARVVYLPFATGSGVADFEPTTRRMLRHRHLGGAMLNGYSGFFPRDHGSLRQTLADFPTAAGLELLGQARVDYVIVEADLLDAPAIENITAVLPLVYEDTAGQVFIFAVDPE